MRLVEQVPSTQIALRAGVIGHGVSSTGTQRVTYTSTVPSVFAKAQNKGVTKTAGGGS